MWSWFSVRWKGVLTAWPTRTQLPTSRRSAASTARSICPTASETGATFPTDAQLIEIARRAAVYGTVPEFIKSGQYVGTVGTWPQIPWSGLVPCGRDTV